MILLLDSTALTSDPMFAGISWRILVHAARHDDVRICVTEVCRRESIANYQRRLTFAADGLAKWGTKYSGLGLDGLQTTVQEDLAAKAADYEQVMASMFDRVPVEILDVPAVDHTTLIDRAVRRTPPCDSNGNGYRDTLNWFTILSLLEASEQETVVWVTADSGDFRDDGTDELHPDLKAELVALDRATGVVLKPSLQEASLYVAANLSAEIPPDLAAARTALVTSELANFVRSELLADPSGVEVDAASLALPVGVWGPFLDEVSNEVTTCTLDVTAPLESGESAIEVTITCTTAIIFEAPLNRADLDLAHALLSEGEAGRVYQTVKELRFRALVTVDEFDRPTGGELLTVRAPEDDPGHELWRAEDWRRRVRVALPPDVQEALRGISNLGISEETRNALKGLGSLGYSDALRNALKGVGPSDEVQRALKGIGPSNDVQRALKGIGLSDEVKRALKGIGGVGYTDALRNALKGLGPSNEVRRGLMGFGTLGLSPEFRKAVESTAFAGPTEEAAPSDPAEPEPNGNDQDVDEQDE